MPAWQSKEVAKRPVGKTTKFSEVEAAGVEPAPNHDRSCAFLRKIARISGFSHGANFGRLAESRSITQKSCVQACAKPTFPFAKAKRVRVSLALHSSSRGRMPL